MKRPTLAITRPLLDWLRQDPTWRQQSWSLRTLLGWRAGLGSLNATLSQQADAGARRAPDTSQLVFIAGPWRSGSTALHELLHAALACATPQTWQCMDPCTFRLQRAPRTGVTAPRPMDGLLVGPNSPQEDEFALLGLGVDSAYRAFWMPHRFDELQHTLDPQHWLDTSATTGWMAQWQSFTAAVLGPHGHLLLKSPNHSFRLPAFLQHYPDAKVVWMLRDGEAVFASNRKMWSQMAAQHGLTPLDPLARDRFIAAALHRCAELLDQLALPAHQLAFCWQPRLQAEPTATVNALLQQLHLPAVVDRTAWQAALRRVAQGRIEHYAPLSDLSPAGRLAIEHFNAAQQRCAAWPTVG